MTRKQWRDHDLYTALVMVVKDYLTSEFVTREDVEFFSRTLSESKVKQAKAQAMKELNEWREIFVDESDKASSTRWDESEDE